MALTILIPVETSSEVEYMANAARQYFPGDTEMIFLHVVDTRMLESLKTVDERTALGLFEQLRAAGDVQLKQAVAALKGSAQSIVVEGNPFVEIIKLSRDLQVDLIAMKTRSNKNPLENVFFGSTADRILRASARPVFCIP